MTVCGRGDAGVAGLYAAVLDSGIGHVVLCEPPVSHENGAPLPTILRETDLDETAALLAPRPLSLLRARRDGFSLTRSIYEASGAEAAFRRVDSSCAALMNSAAPDGGEAPC